MPYKNPEEKRAYSRAYGAVYSMAHKDEIATYKAAYYIAHREELAAHRDVHRAERVAYDAAYYAVHREEIAAYKAAYQAAHREEKVAYDRAYNAVHREEQSAYNRAYKKMHPQETNERSRRRDALKRGATVGKIDIEAIKIRDRMRCSICGKKVAMKDFSLDHTIPLSLGGPHTQNNLRVAHLRHNIQRGAGRIPVQMVLH